MVEQLIQSLFGIVEINNALNNTFQIQKAINRSSDRLYLEHRDNFGINQESTDYLQEFYQLLNLNSDDPIVIPSTAGGFTIDVVKMIELRYVSNGPLYGVKVVPDNEFDMLKDNPVVGPIQKRPLGRLRGEFSYEVLPAGWLSGRARTLVLPTPTEFTLADNGTPIPDITVIQDFQWLPEKQNKLLSYTIEYLGMTLNSPALLNFAKTFAATLP